LDFSGNRKGLSSLWILIIGIVVILAVLLVALAFWFWPSNLKTEEMEFSDFTAVEVSRAFEVKITQSSSYSVIISADEKIFGNIEVTQNGNTLVIGLKPGSPDPGNLFRKAEITMPELNKLILSGAIKGSVDGFSNSNTFVLSVSGASSLEMNNINLGNAEIEVTGASDLNARGTANDLSLLVSGASNLDLSGFPVNNVDIVVDGASRATINLDGRLDADVSGASRLEYVGDPTMGDINVSIDSTLKKK
jgi:hypothetical protein